jgi:hypothetical protein
MSTGGPIARTIVGMIAACAVACGGGGDSPSDAPPGTIIDARAGTIDARPGIVDAPPADPCGNITEDGICKTSTSVELCVIPSGNGTPMLETYNCQQGDTCQIVAGKATCVLTAECHEGDTECTSATAIRSCQGGHWVAATCPKQCISSPVGDFCGLNATTKPYAGTLQYQARGPNANPPTDWGGLVSVPARGFLVVSARIPASGPIEYIDSKYTDEGATVPGAFTVQVPTTPQATDYLVFMALGIDSSSGQADVAYAVADPDLASSTTPYDVPSVGASPRIWSWSIQTSTLTPSEVITIPEASGSGAARIFDVLRYVHESDAARFPGQAAVPVVAWVGGGVEWSCGKCEGAIPTTQFGTMFGAQVFFAGGADQSYWADAVTAHELGHWTMGTYGRSVGEGGTHCIGVPDAPGLGWSEGYATWFSADVREDPLYLDKQQGSMFWLDISQRTGYAWTRPTAGDGLLQDIDENEISAMLWDMATVQGIGHVPIDDALASPRMTAPPFARGYTLHGWDIDGSCHRINIQDSGESTTCFADLLDALVCGGVSAAVVDNATNPAVNYPYPSGAPLCQ